MFILCEKLAIKQAQDFWSISSIRDFFQDNFSVCNRTIQIDTQKKIAWLAKTSFEKGSAYSGFSFELDLVDVLVYSWPRLPSMVPFHLLLMFLTASSLFSLMFHLMFVFHHFNNLYTSMQKKSNHVSSRFPNFSLFQLWKWKHFEKWCIFSMYSIPTISLYMGVSKNKF